MSCHRSWDLDWLQTVVFPPGSCLPANRPVLVGVYPRDCGNGRWTGHEES
jgi:hypothetical protein